MMTMILVPVRCMGLNNHFLSVRDTFDLPWLVISKIFWHPQFFYFQLFFIQFNFLQPFFRLLTNNPHAYMENFM